MEKLAADPPAGAEGLELTRRAEVDTSAPFESVKEAVDRFGGSAVWKLQLKQLFAPEKHHSLDELEHMTVGEQTSKLKMDLITKERETLDVLKELEITKRIVDELKRKLHKEPSDANNIPGMISSDNLVSHPDDHVDSVGPSILLKRSPGLILMELKQAKLNLNRTTNDLASIRSSIELLNSKIKEEKVLLEKTQQRLSLNTVKAASLEEELNRKKLELQRTEDTECNPESSSNIRSRIEQLNSQKEQCLKITEKAESEVLQLTAEIKETHSNIKAGEIRLRAAKKMEEAARVVEAAALAEINALTNSECDGSSKIVLSVEEYDMLMVKAREAGELSRKKIEAAMLLVEEANRSKEDLLRKVEETKADVETSKKALEDALTREAAANREKLAVEAALRKWRSEHGQKRRSTNSSTKFKNSCTTPNRRDLRMLDVNGLSLGGSELSPPVPMLSIGQILSRKLTDPDKYEGTPEVLAGKSKVSLGQILSRRHGSLSPQISDDDGANGKRLSTKRKKLGLGGFSLRLTAKNKKSKKKKRQTRNPPGNCRPKLVSLLV